MPRLMPPFPFQSGRECRPPAASMRLRASIPAGRMPSSGARRNEASPPGNLAPPKRATAAVVRASRACMPDGRLGALPSRAEEPTIRLPDWCSEHAVAGRSPTAAARVTAQASTDRCRAIDRRRRSCQTTMPDSASTSRTTSAGDRRSRLFKRRTTTRGPLTHDSRAIACVVRRDGSAARASTSSSSTSRSRTVSSPIRRRQYDSPRSHAGAPAPKTSRIRSFLSRVRLAPRNARR